jgi:hypothetical protein
LAQMRKAGGALSERPPASGVNSRSVSGREY